MRIILATTIALLLAAPQVAFAQEGNDAGTPPKKTEYTFPDVEVNGTFVKPLTSGVHGDVHGKTSSIVKVRHDFVREVLRSADDV